MTDKLPVLGYSIITGNPVEGFSLYGFFESIIAACEAAEHDKTMPPDWWVISIYRQN